MLLPSGYFFTRQFTNYIFTQAENGTAVMIHSERQALAIIDECCYYHCFNITDENVLEYEY